MTWQPTLTWQNAQKRAEIIQQIRQFFVERNVVEVETPALSQGTVTDIHLDAFVCKYNFLTNSSTEQSVNLYLQTSPEFHMKRLLASGYGCIYSIAKAFRHEEAGRHHNPEFTLLEWYRIGFNQFDLMSEVSELLKTILGVNKPIFTSYQDIFISRVGIDPLTTSFDELVAVLTQHNKADDWLIKQHDCDALLQFIFTEIIEPTIGINEPCFVYNFPRQQASLAKVSEQDLRVAERFECYYRGIEFAIKMGLKRYDAGAQGEHKLVRGFEPIRTHSLHWIKHPEFKKAIAKFLDEENYTIDAHIEQANEMLPFKKS